MGPLDLIFPKFCLNCRKRGVYLCSDCLQKVGISSGAFFKHQYLNGLISIWAYEGVVRKAILALKYRFASEIAREMAELFSQALKQRFLPFQDPILVPVPLARKRQNWRGFNQSAVLGKLICQKMNWDFQPDLILRHKNTRPQAELSQKDRRLNIQGVFVMNQSKMQNTGRDILIFDDVATTGATLEEAAKVLRHAGAKKIYGLTLAS